MAVLVVGAALWGGLYLLTGHICLLQAWVGLPCPGCGLTRAALYLFSGNIGAMWAMHPLVVLALGVLAYLGWRGVYRPRTPMSRRETAAIAGVGGLFVGVYVLRMVWLFPHTAPLTINEDALLRVAIRWMGGIFS